MTRSRAWLVAGAVWLALAGTGAAVEAADPLPERPPRYLLYRVNPAEGFNLRRDAFLRAALLVRRLGPPWVLVLPPFPSMLHWTGGDTDPDRAVRWSTYFDVDAIARVVPIVEWETFRARRPDPIDLAWLLLPASGSGAEQPQLTKVPCDGSEEFRASYRRGDDARPFVSLDGRTETGVARVECHRVFAPSSALAGALPATEGRTVLVDRFERLFWDPLEYGGATWWQARRGLRFAPRLVREAARWRAATLGDEPYLAVHWRRGDFVLTGRRVASAADVAARVRRLRARLGIQRVVLATDAGESELRELRALLDFDRYVAAPAGEWLDGEVAILDQILASGAVHFVGTGGSTFSTVIMEERELADHPSGSTWNVLCAGESSSAEPPACDQPEPRRPPVP